jgi:iron complex outermembrane receptor protein
MTTVAHAVAYALARGKDSSRLLLRMSKLHAAPGESARVRKYLRGSLVALGGSIWTLMSAAAVSAEGTLQDPMTHVIVIAPYGATLERERVPANVQVSDAEEIERLQPLDITELLNRSFAGVNINHAQNNPLQPDVNYRGFTASPLLGLPQGLAVYQNGVRINEPFGDTVNWDLIPLSALQSVQLIGGANPVFGLNSLGGALSLQTKTGFDYRGTEMQVHGGSFGRRAASLQYGGSGETFGFYGNVDYFEEDGWRDYSDSQALRYVGVVSWRGENDSALNLALSGGETELRGNGASPVELLELDRKQVFTHPDITENSQFQVILDGQRRLSDSLVLSGVAHYRRIDTDSFNGDGTIFEECEFGDDEFLVEEDFDDENGDGECSFDDDDDIVLVLDPQGNPIEAEMDGEELDAINNIGRREQKHYGASVQLAWAGQIGGRRNDLLIGASASEGRISFNSATEVARLLGNRATSRTGIFAQEFFTDVKSEVSVAGLYFSNTLDLTDRAALTLSGRYDTTRIRLADRTGESPELNGNHRFERFNPALGLTVRLSESLTMFGSFGESTRTPTPVELACASEDAPCNLPNAFLADPPLDQVVARTAEIGLRGSNHAGLNWSISAFHSTNRDDILFQTTGGAQANVGFFDNVGDTRRTGAELSISQGLERLHWYFDYSYVDATFRDAFTTNSPNHPLFEEDDAPQIVGEDKVLVPRGATIPGIPQHQANIGADFLFTPRFSIGADVTYRSGVYLRGDEINALGKTDAYTVVNLRGEWRINDMFTVFARVENVFDEEYETFGLLGEPDEVFPDFKDPRFYGSGPPRGGWVGVKLKF